MITVSRAINGICLNGDEFLLTDEGEVMEFESEEQAKQFLLDHGASEDEIYYFKFHNEN